MTKQGTQDQTKLDRRKQMSARDPLWMEGDDVALGKDEKDTEPAYTYDTLEEMYEDD